MTSPTRIQKGLSFFLLLSLGTFALAWYMKQQLPVTLPRAELFQEPVQTETEKEPFSIEYRGESYYIEPQYEYELWGLVVSHNDISSWSDWYHDSDSFDTKDLCVIWGENLRSEDYREVEYESGSWTCYFTYGSDIDFSGDQLSNNHLITDDERIRELIQSVHVGDQIHFRGQLVNYSYADGFTRKSSTSRTDSGNHACEVVFVEEIEVLEKANTLWHQLFFWSRYVFLLLLALKIFLFFLYQYQQNREWKEKRLGNFHKKR